MSEESTPRRMKLPVTGLVVLVAGLALMVALSWRAAGRLPSTVTFVGAGRGGRDQHLPRLLVLTLMPALALLIGVVGLSMQRVRRSVAARLNLPPWRDDVTHRRATDVGLGVLVPVLLALHLVWLRAAEGAPWAGLGFVAAAVAVVLIGVGNAWPKRAPALPEAVREDVEEEFAGEVEDVGEDVTAEFGGVLGGERADVAEPVGLVPVARQVPQCGSHREELVEDVFQGLRQLDVILGIFGARQLPERVWAHPL
jgi:hypothetical protein